MLHYQAGCREAHNPTTPQGRKERGNRPPPARQAHKEREKEGKRNERKAATSPQAHKPTKKGYPPHRQGAGIPSPHHKFAPKNQQKVAWGDLKKFSEKFFVGMFRGKKNPLRYLNGRGRQQMKNCGLSNLSNASNQKHKNINHQGQR